MKKNAYCFKANRLIALLALCSALPLLLQAEEEPVYDGPIYIQPLAGYLPLRIDIVEDMIDGNPSTYSKLSCSLFVGQSSRFVGWSGAKGQSSLTMQRTYWKDHRVHFYVWPRKSAYLPDLSEASLVGFAEGLKKQFPETVKILNEGNRFRTTHGIHSPFNAETRMVSYVKTNLSNQKKTQFNHYFLFTDEAFVEIVFEAPSDTISSATSHLANFINGMADEL